jgi:hypothetical protein
VIWKSHYLVRLVNKTGVLARFAQQIVAKVFNSNKNPIDRGFDCEQIILFVQLSNTLGDVFVWMWPITLVSKPPILGVYASLCKFMGVYGRFWIFTETDSVLSHWYRNESG